MTGHRLGYIAAPKHIVDACAKIQSHNTTCPSSITQYAGVSALTETPESFFTEAIAGFRVKRDLVLSALKKADIECKPPNGAFYVFFSVQTYLSESEFPTTSEEVCVYILEKYQVGLVPGEAFGLPGYLRLSYATSVPTLEEAMERIVAGLLSLKRK
jgi:aspartate/methionine/tyrosine aminotransferase